MILPSEAQFQKKKRDLDPRNDIAFRGLIPKKGDLDNGGTKAKTCLILINVILEQFLFGNEKRPFED